MIMLYSVKLKIFATNLTIFFTNVGPNMAMKIPPSSDNNLLNTISSPGTVNSFFCEPCTESEVYQEIMNLNQKKATGIENIPIKFIKMTAEYISSLLSEIFNKCILDGIFPTKLKRAKVTPIFKGGSTQKSTNYRPISVLSPFSKVFEKIINNRLSKYFSKYNIIAKEQFGFRAKHATTHAISDIVNKIQNLRDNENYTCVILVDLSTLILQLFIQ